MKTIKTIVCGAMLLLTFACNKDKIGLKPSGVDDQSQSDRKIIIIKPPIRNDMPNFYHSTERTAPTGVRNDPPLLNNNPSRIAKPGVRNDPPRMYLETL